MDNEQFKSDLQASELLWNIPSHLDDLVNTYMLLFAREQLYTRLVYLGSLMKSGL